MDGSWTRAPAASEREQLLGLAVQLAEPNLSIETRLGLVDRMYQVLNHNTLLEEVQ